jgi:hypothetical protein
MEFTTMKFYNYYLNLIMYSYVAFLGYLSNFSHDHHYAIMITTTWLGVILKLL